jgi:uncharacterized protein (TIGR02453 family)
MSARASTSAAAGFTGFPKDAMAFWHELAIEMNKSWFDANKARYEEQWVAPMRALLGDVRGKLAASYRGMPLAEPKILRIYRDVRFAKDKAPYKTWIGGAVRAGVTDGAPQDGVVAIYAHFGLDEEWVGAGQYVFADAALARWRRAVADRKKGPVIGKLVAALGTRGYSIEAAETSARVPKPYPADHPRAELLRKKGLVVGFPAIPRGLIHKPAFTAWLVTHAKAAAPLAKWIYANVT